jgi:hypothetical protein
MQRMKRLSLLLSCILSAMSCSDSKTVRTADSAVHDSVALTTTNTPDCRVEAEFVIENLPEDSASLIVPYSAIRVKACDSLYEIAKVAGDAEVYIMKEFREKEIPGEALTACGGWYAGGGDYYYLVVNKNNGIDVYHGWQDEGQTDNGYHWTKVTELLKKQQ